MRDARPNIVVRSSHPVPWGFETSLALFDRVTRLAKSLFESVEASIILVHDGTLWRSCWADALPPDDPVTVSVLANGEPLWVEDGRRVPTIADNPMVKDYPYLRFTASTPIRLPDGSVPGVLSVAGPKPHPYDAGKAARLQDLADLVADEWIRAKNAKALAESAKERDLALERLRESEAMYRLLADHQTDVIVRYEPDGTIVFVSPSVRLYGYEPSDLIGRNVAAVCHPDDVEGMLRTREAVAAGVDLGPRPHLLFRVTAADNRTFWAEGSPVAVRNDEGAVIGFVTGLRDVTVRQALEAELRRRQAEAEASSQAKAEFLANMTHELRTPLNAIVGFCGVLKDAPDLPPRHAHHVGLVWSASQTLLGIVNDVLEFSKLDAGAVEFDLAPFDPKAMVQSTVALLAGQATAKGLQIHVDASGPDARLMGDAPRLRQVLTNLISNAVKFTAKGAIKVHVSQGGEGTERRLRIAVTDTGIGVAPDQIHAIFTRFAQADASVSRKFGGTGLGLAISKRIVEAMGGEIGAESVLGEGSTFWFEAPLNLAFEDESPKDAHAPSASVDGALRLLVVDDNAVNLELICTLLDPFDIAIQTASNGVEAVDAAAQFPFDVILMDVQMPTMDGLTATRRIRAAASADRPRVPIVAMTANVLPEQVARCLDAGMDDHIGKPISPTTLLETLARWASAEEAPSSARV